MRHHVKAQGVLEYLVMLTGIVAVFIIIAPNAMRSAVDKAVDDAGDTIESIDLLALSSTPQSNSGIPYDGTPIGTTWALDSNGDPVPRVGGYPIDYGYTSLYQLANPYSSATGYDQRMGSGARNEYNGNEVFLDDYASFWGDARAPDMIRVFIPPGAKRIIVGLPVTNSLDSGFVASWNHPPSSDITTDDYSRGSARRGGVNDLSELAGDGVIFTKYSEGWVYIVDTSPSSAPLQEGGWLYIKNIYKGTTPMTCTAGGVCSYGASQTVGVQVSVWADAQTYSNWYDSLSYSL